MTEPQVYAFDHFGTTEAGERWIAEVSVDFSAYDAVQFAASLEAVVRGAGGSFHVKVGGAARATGGLTTIDLPGDGSGARGGGLAFGFPGVAGGEAAAEVVEVKVERLGAYGLKYTVKTRMAGDDGSDVTISDTLPGDG
jgi:hypothetical protein